MTLISQDSFLIFLDTGVEGWTHCWTPSGCRLIRFVSASPAAPRHGAAHDTHSPEAAAPSPPVNRHRPRRPRKDGAALRYLAEWRREVERAERLHQSGSYVYTGSWGCPCCQGEIWDDSRDRLEALVHRGGKHAHRLRAEVNRLDERFRAVTMERDA